MIEITDCALIRLRSLPDADAAVVLDARLRALEMQWKHSFIERGVILIEVQERQLWRFMGNYHSFEAWVSTAAPHSRADCFQAMRAVRELQDIPKEDLLEIPRVNIGLLQSLSSTVRQDQSVIEAAKVLPEKEFRDKIRTEHPGQHIEGRRKLTFCLADSVADLIEADLNEVGVTENIPDRNGQLEWVFQDWRDGGEKP